jgi:hypothetical protein
MYLRPAIVEAAESLSLYQEPASFTTKIQGIPLKGRSELFGARLGHKHSRLEFEASKKPNSEDSSVKIDYVSNNKVDHMQLRSDDSQLVEFGGNKLFTLHAEGRGKALGALSCSDLCTSLDFALPDVKHRLSALVDPRNPYTFDFIAARMGTFLGEKATKTFDRRTFLTKDISVSELDYRIMERGARLTVDTNREKRHEQTRVRQTRYTLSLTAPYELEEGRVMRHFEYSFTNAPEYGRGGKDYQLMFALARITLASCDLSTDELKHYADYEATEVDGYDLSAQAIGLLSQQSTLR